jgi:NNP family nitrate/nitrite transporter-like MFS transporter
MVSVPILFGGLLRIVLGLMVDRIGAKRTGCIAQCIVIAGLTAAWLGGLKSFEATLFMGAVLGVAGASFAVAVPQAGRWYPPQMQGLVMGLAGAAISALSSIRFLLRGSPRFLAGRLFLASR